MGRLQFAGFATLPLCGAATTWFSADKAMPGMMIDGGNILSASGRNARLPDDRGRLATFVLGVIFAGGLFDIALLAIEIDTDWSDRPVHLLAVLTLLFMLAAVGFGFRLLRNRMARSPAEQGVLDDLRRDKEAAETSNLAKARYLANVSHEIRSPLNAIYGYAQLIEQEANVQPKDAARIIRRCAEHMTSLVESLLDISRAQNGVLRLRNEVVRLPDFIEQIVMMMRPAAQAKGLEFICENAGRLPEFIRIDQSRFRQALINLLTNAIKFTDRGSVTFRISYRGQTATFEVIDTGPGIAPEDQRRIFDPYERIGIGEVAAQPGIGLGLPITKAIVEILGGMLELESTPGDGACFRIVMMLGEVAGMQVPATAQRRICGYDGAQRSILIVDDDPDQRSFLEEYLKACGFEVIVAPDGETAVDLCKLGIFDLAILDISLPGISGWETAMLLREGARRDLAIIMASANAQEFDRPDHHKPVHDLFFIKPYRLDEMAEAIGALLELSWKWEALGQAAAPAADGKTALPEAALAHVARLKELLRIGHVRGIEAEIELLERIPMIDKKLVSTLFAALDDFDLTGMALILEEM